MLNKPAKKTEVTAETQFDRMTGESVKKLIISLGIPTTISMLVTNIYNMADTYFVGKLGTSASGAVGVVFGFMALMQALAFMFGQGAGSIISRKLGEKRDEEAHVYGSTSLFVTLGLGILITVTTLTFNDEILNLLGTTETIKPYAGEYMFYISLAAPFIMGSFVLNNILRFEGKASLAMIGLVTGGVLNIIGDPILIYKFDMGIAGAGLATAVSQFISFIILLMVFLSGNTQIKLSVRRVSLKADILIEIITTGFPSAVRQGLASVSTMLLNQAAGNYTDAAIAAMSIVNRLSFFMFAVGLGIGQGFQPVCGYNYGAKRYDRVKEAMKFTFVVTEIVLVIFAALGLIFSDGLIEMFRDDEEVVSFGTPALRMACAALVFQPLNVIANMTFQSTGKRWLATFSSMLRSGLYFIPLLLMLEPCIHELGVQLAQPLADVLSFFTVMPFILKFYRNPGRQEV